jgi:hypothetical protein
MGFLRFRVETGLASLCLDAAAVCAEAPCFAPSGDSLFFEMRKEK